MKVHEKWEKTHILSLFGEVYRYTLNMYRYTLVSGHFLANVYRYTLGVYRYTLFWFSCFDQFWYFGHNLLIS